MPGGGARPGRADAGGAGRGPVVHAQPGAGHGNLSWFATLKTIEEDAGVEVGTWPEEETKA